MITNADYLIQKFAEAREKMRSAYNEAADNYWKGAMDTYHSLLNSSFDDWAENGTTGYFVFYEGMNYDEALNAVNRIEKPANEIVH